MSSSKVLHMVHRPFEIWNKGRFFVTNLMIGMQGIQSEIRVPVTEVFSQVVCKNVFEKLTFFPIDKIPVMCCLHDLSRRHWESKANFFLRWPTLVAWENAIRSPNGPSEEVHRKLIRDAECNPYGFWRSPLYKDVARSSRLMKLDDYVSRTGGMTLIGKW
jgi:hypothetical protein